MPIVVDPMTQQATRADSSPADIAARLVSARLDARPLEVFPGVAPTTLAAAYQIQQMAIHLWPDDIAGWKIGLVAPHMRAALGSDRVAGPIFAKQVRMAGESEVAFPVFVGGFAAVEAEFVFRMAKDAPADKTEWTADEAAALVGSLHIGVETAGSPMAFINDMGSTVVASDFGNNAGLILGAPVADWQARLGSLSAATAIEGVQVGAGEAMGLPGGPMAGLTFLLAHLAARGQPLKAGQYVSSGAVTGVHDIVEGQSATLSFGPDGAITCRAVAAKGAGG